MKVIAPASLFGPLRKFVIIFLLLMFVPIGASAAKYWIGGRGANWQTADRSSAGL